MRFHGLNLGPDIVGPFGAFFDPPLDRRDLVVSKTTPHGHARDVADSRHALIKRTRGGISGDNNLREHRLFGIEPQPGHLCLRAVAHNAGFLEDGLDVVNEVYFIWLLSGAAIHKQRAGAEGKCRQHDERRNSSRHREGKWSGNDIRLSAKASSPDGCLSERSKECPKGAK